MTDCSFLKLFLVQMFGVPMRIYTILIICLAKNGMKNGSETEKSINSLAALQLKTMQRRAMKLYRWNAKVLKNRFIFI